MQHLHFPSLVPKSITTRNLATDDYFGKIFSNRRNNKIIMIVTGESKRNTFGITFQNQFIRHKIVPSFAQLHIIIDILLHPLLRISFAIGRNSTYPIIYLGIGRLHFGVRINKRILNIALIRCNGKCYAFTS